MVPRPPEFSGRGGCGCCRPEQNSWGGGRRGSWPRAAAGEGRAGPWSHQPHRLDQTNKLFQGPQVHSRKDAAFRISRGSDRVMGLLSTAPGSQHGAFHSPTDLQRGWGQGSVHRLPLPHREGLLSQIRGTRADPLSLNLSQGEAHTYLPLIGLSSRQLSYKPQGQGHTHPRAELYQEAGTSVPVGPAPGKPGWGSVWEVWVTSGSHSRLWAQVRDGGRLGLTWDHPEMDDCVSACTIHLPAGTVPPGHSLTTQPQLLLSGEQMCQQEPPQGIPVLGLHMGQD